MKYFFEYADEILIKIFPQKMSKSKNMNILIVDDEKSVADALIKIIEKIPEANIVRAVQGFDEGLEKAMSDIFDVVIADIVLQGDHRDGIRLCREIKNRKPNMPVMVITGHHQSNFLEKAFENGVNDYVKKPFDKRELQLRTKRWTTFAKETSLKKTLTYKDISYDTNKNHFSICGEKINLSKQDKNLLLIFLKNPEKLLSHDFLQQKIWGDYDLTKSRNVRSNVNQLRNHLPLAHRDWIQTVRGEGYILQK